MLISFPSINFSSFFSHGSNSIGRIQHATAPYVKFASLQASNSVQWLVNKKWQIAAVVAGLLIVKISFFVTKNYFNKEADPARSPPPSSTAKIDPLKDDSNGKPGEEGDLTVPITTDAETDDGKKIKFFPEKPPSKRNVIFNHWVPVHEATGMLVGGIVGIALNAFFNSEDLEQTESEEKVQRQQALNYLRTAFLAAGFGIAIGFAIGREVKLQWSKPLLKEPGFSELNEKKADNKFATVEQVEKLINSARATNELLGKAIELGEKNLQQRNLRE